MATTTVTQTLPAPTLRLRASTPADAKEVQTETQDQETYRYAALLPEFNREEHYPPLEPFDHVDPGSRALSHPSPASFLDGASNIFDITPNLGTEVTGVNLATLSNDERDQLALKVCSYSRLGSSSSFHCFFLLGSPAGTHGIQRST